MGYEAKVIADSVNPDGVRLTTMTLTYPRFVHAEFMTHRAFSRNAASSRAIPGEKFRQQVEEDPAWPVWWGANQSGMQAFEELDERQRRAAMILLEELRLLALRTHRMLSDPEFRFRFDDAGRLRVMHFPPDGGEPEEREGDFAINLHKQVANRYLEPWFWITTLATGTASAWANFFGLRCHWAAQPEMREAAIQAADAYFASEPRPLDWADWHLPFIQDDETEGRATFGTLAKVSAARCARISYLTHEGTRDVNKDLELFERLQNPDTPAEYDPDTPRHVSPFEHVAQAWDCLGDLGGNFEAGWRQLRKGVPNEARRTFTLVDLQRRCAEIGRRFGRLVG